MQGPVAQKFFPTVTQEMEYQYGYGGHVVRKAGFGFAGLVIVAAIVTLIVLLVRKRRSTPTTSGGAVGLALMTTQQPVTAAPSVPTYTLPPVANTVNLAYMLKLTDNSRSGIAYYSPPFKAAFISDAKVAVPTAATDLDQLLLDCQRAYGAPDGTLIAEAAIVAFMNSSNRDLLP